MPFDLSNIGWIVVVGAAIVLGLYRFQVLSSLIDFKRFRDSSIKDKTAELLKKYQDRQKESD